ncbi:hypothetical protein D3C80_1412430 [compost metagenome]
MDTAVVVIGRVEGGNAVLLGPVRLEVGKRLVIETTDQRQRMRVGFELGQVFAVLRQRATLLPERLHARVVLPAVETLQVMLDLQGTQRYPTAQARIEAPVHFAPRLGRPARVALAVADLHLLRIYPGNRLAQPRLRQLPEQCALAQVLARLFTGQQQATGQRLRQHFGQVPGQALAGRIARQ